MRVWRGCWIGGAGVCLFWLWGRRVNSLILGIDFPKRACADKAGK